MYKTLNEWCHIAQECWSCAPRPVLSIILSFYVLGNVIGNKLYLIAALTYISLISNKAKLCVCIYGLCESLLELFVPLIFLPVYLELSMRTL